MGNHLETEDQVILAGDFLRVSVPVTPEHFHAQLSAIIRLCGAACDPGYRTIALRDQHVSGPAPTTTHIQDI